MALFARITGNGATQLTDETKTKDGPVVIGYPNRFLAEAMEVEAPREVRLLQAPASLMDMLDKVEAAARASQVQKTQPSESQE